jgi:hypothetical protein
VLIHDNWTTIDRFLQQHRLALQMSDSTRLPIHLGMALGGKVFLVVTGDVSSAQAATETGRMAAPEAMLMTPRRELFHDGM